MKPVLLVMAAGMGSRYGGLKQIDPIGPNGEIIIDYSMYDAMKAGFTDVYFVIKEAIADDFKKIVENGAGKHLSLHYLYQELYKIPEGFSIPEGREKPWGTGHAILMAKGEIEAPFAVINADDYYGASAFRSMYEYLSKAEDTGTYDFSMIGYQIENTITEHGSVARGICSADENNYLTSIKERLKVQLHEGRIADTEDEGETWIDIPRGTLVSMNFFGFTPSILNELERLFPEKLKEFEEKNPLKGEFLIPEVVGQLMREGKAKVKVIPSEDKWYGVTYKEDKAAVVAAMQEKIKAGIYPEKLW